MGQKPRRQTAEGRTSGEGKLQTSDCRLHTSDRGRRKNIFLMQSVSERGDNVGVEMLENIGVFKRDCHSTVTRTFQVLGCWYPRSSVFILAAEPELYVHMYSISSVAEIVAQLQAYFWAGDIFCSDFSPPDIALPAAAADGVLPAVALRTRFGSGRSFLVTSNSPRSMVSPGKVSRLQTL